MLTKCAMCHKEMSGLSDKCPGCGHPNAWVHPTITKFNSSPQLDDHKNLHITSGKNWVKGTTRYISSMPLWQLILIWAVSVFTGFIPIACYGAYRLYRYVGNKSADEFCVEIKTDQWIWQSSNDTHWKNTKNFFETALSLQAISPTNLQSPPVNGVRAAHPDVNKNKIKKILEKDFNELKEIGADIKRKRGIAAAIEGFKDGFNDIELESSKIQSLRISPAIASITTRVTDVTGIKESSATLNEVTKFHLAGGVNCMEPLLDSTNAGSIEQSFDVRTLDSQEIQSIMPAIQAWAQNYSVEQLKDLHDKIAVTQATLYPIPWIQLRTRFETRKLTNKSRAYQSGSAYEKKKVSEKNFSIWSYPVRDTSIKLEEGKSPEAVTQKVSNSDAIHDCSTCNTHGILTCSQCDGHGSHICGSCDGDKIVKCSSCGGNGQSRCFYCNGRGENDCPKCTAGRRSDGSRCDSCSGRGYTRCHSCRDGFNNCSTCSAKGEVSCSTCHATGDVTCSRCSGHGELECDKCEGSGELINSFYITSSQSEAVATQYVFPSDYLSLVPEDVNDWIKNGIGMNTTRNKSSERFDVPPVEHSDPRLMDAGNFLIAESCKNVKWKSDSEALNIAFNSSIDKIIMQWYAENYIPLVKVDYQFEGNGYVLWSVAPCVTTTVPNTMTNRHAKHFKIGTSVYASESPIHEYVKELFYSIGRNLGEVIRGGLNWMKNRI
jgi:hypothetical protein